MPARPNYESHHASFPAYCRFSWELSSALSMDDVTGVRLEAENTIRIGQFLVFRYPS